MIILNQNQDLIKFNFFFLNQNYLELIYQLQF